LQSDQSLESKVSFVIHDKLFYCSVIKYLNGLENPKIKLFQNLLRN